MTGRGRLKVEQDSWHWRWYNEWRRNKGMDRTERSQVDLCHYMRVLLIFGPWRWFWDGDLFGDLPAFVYTALLAIVGVAVWAFVTWPTGSLIVLGIVALLLIAAAVIFGIGYSIRRWYIKDTDAADAFIDRVLERIEKFAYYAFFPLWWPLYWLAIGIKRAGIKIGKGLYRVGEIFFTKQLFNVPIGGEMMTFTPAGIVLPLVVLAALAEAFYHHPVLMGIIFGSIIGAILLAALIVLLGKRIKRWAKEDAEKAVAKKTLTPPETPKEPNVFWTWLMAKKHRVCPLIELEGGAGDSSGTAFGSRSLKIPTGGHNE